MPEADTIRDLDVEIKRCPDCGARFGIDAAFCPFDGIPLKRGTWDKGLDPLANAIVDERYEILEPLGQGGMGTVYRTRHVTLDRLFALKVLRSDLAKDVDLSARFVQEARATAAIKHSSVVSINDFGALDDGSPYFVMELLVGETLATRVRARGPMAPREVIDVARKIADALAASHAAGVIHRDLKPDNVFLVGKAAGKGETEEIRIVDFGAAKVIGGSKLTRPGVVFGTPYYMSPEQAGGQPVDGRADVYSLGVLMFEMLTGRVPFQADTYMGVLTKHMFEAPARPSECVPLEVEMGGLDDVVMRALEKEPERRYASMVELGDALAAAAASLIAPRALRQRARGPRAPSGDRAQPHSGKRQRDRERGKRQLIVVTFAAAVSTLLFGTAVVLFVGSRHTSVVPVVISALPPSPAPLPTRSTPTEAPQPAPPPQSAQATVAVMRQEPPTTEIVARPEASAGRRRAPSAPARGRFPERSPDAAPSGTTAGQAPPTKGRSEDFMDPWNR